MSKMIYIAIILALFGCNTTGNKNNASNAEGGKEVKKFANTTGFVNYAEDPIVLSPGIKGEWDAGAVGTMAVVKVVDTFHMFYEAWGSLGHEGGEGDYESLQIGHATSKDGIKWEKDPANPIIAAGTQGEWEEDGTWDPFVIFEDGIFKMWYGGGNADHCNWGYATSKDGSKFEKHGQISHLGNVEDIHVVHNLENDKYYLFYWDRAKAPWNDIMDSVPPLPSGLHVAISNDETNFDFENAQRLKVEGQDWPVKYSHVIREEEQWMMIYGEAVTRGNPSSTGIATSTDLINWTKRVFQW